MLVYCMIDFVVLLSRVVNLAHAHVGSVAVLSTETIKQCCQLV